MTNSIALSKPSIITKSLTSVTVVFLANALSQLFHLVGAPLIMLRVSGRNNLHE